MSAKLLCATAVLAMGSLSFIDTADAQRRGGGAERGGKANVQASGQRRGGARQARGNRNAGQTRGARRKAQTNQAQPHANRANRANRTPTRAAQRQTAPRAAQRQGRNFNRRQARRNPVARGWRQARRWAGRRWAARPYFTNHACTAVARRNDGYGRTIRGIYGEGYGRRACSKALNRCENQLSYLQASGRNPYAACVVASR